MNLSVATFSVIVISGLMGNSTALEKLRFFNCQDMRACRGNCVYQNRDGKFLIDKKSDTVKMVVYENEQVVRSFLIETCKAIFDEKNWDCSSETHFRGGLIRHVREMTEGIYYGSDFSYMTDNNNAIKAAKVSETCAK